MTKNLQISIIILVVLIGLFFLNKSSQSSLETKSIPIFSNNIEDISKFLIQNKEDSIQLVKVDTFWTIAENDTLEIKSQSIDNLFNKVLKTNRGTIISNNPEKYKKYSIDDSTGTHLTIINSKNETINYYIFGRSQSDYSRSYVRIQNDPKVYLTDQNVSFMLQTRPTYWGQKPKENIPIESDTTKIK